jgi:hypothetical protein
MKNYIVRLRNYEGFIVDGEIYEAPNEQIAKEMYVSRCKRLGIVVGKYDYITVETM